MKNARAVHLLKVGLFLLLSCADLVLTCRLLSHGYGQFYESNPVAGFWLDSFGWMGLAAFKAAMVLVAVGLFLVLARYCPRIAQRVLTFSCLAVAMVVAYSCFLASVHAKTLDEIAVLQQEEAQLDSRVAWHRKYIKIQIDLQKRLIAGEYTLQEAVDVLSHSEMAQNSFWLQHLHTQFPGASPKEGMAIHLIGHTLAGLEDDLEKFAAVQYEMEKQFQVAYGHSCPRVTTPEIPEAHAE